MIENFDSIKRRAENGRGVVKLMEVQQLVHEVERLRGALKICRKVKHDYRKQFLRDLQGNET